MHEQAIAIFCICEEVLQAFQLTDDPQCKMSSSEVMTLGLLSAIHYHCNYRKTRLVSIALHYFQNILSISQLNRRIHAIPNAVWIMVFSALQVYLKKSSSEYFIVDSFPVKSYETHKSFRAKIFQGKRFHGYSASKKAYFFGIKVHMIVDENGVPFAFCFTPGSTSDIEGLKLLPCELPIGTVLLADKAYTNYDLEDDLKEMLGITLLPKRKNNLKRQNTGCQEFIIRQKRNRIETVFSQIINKMPRYIKARTETGFYLKITLFIVSHVVCKALPIID